MALMDKIITIDDARKIISSSIEEQEKYFKSQVFNIDEEIIKSIPKYESFLSDLICYKWSLFDPDMFLKCYVTDETYNKLSDAQYSWYMTFKNKSNFNDLLEKYKCNDFFKYKEGSNEIYSRRKKLIIEIYHTQNIIFWIINNIRVKL